MSFTVLLKPKGNIFKVLLKHSKVGMNLKELPFFSLFIQANRKFSPFYSVRGDIPINNFIKPEKIKLDYWKKVLWVAFDLKRMVWKKNKRCLNFLETKHVTLLFQQPHGRFHVAFSLACSILGARKTFYLETNFTNQPNAADCGRVLSELTDMIVVHGIDQSILIKLADSASVPIFPASCNIYSIQKVLCDLMTIFEKFKKLKGLTLTWVGPPMSTFNTYMLLCPLFGINLNYLCICIYGSGQMSPVMKSKKNVTNSKYINDFNELKDAITGANIVTTAMHTEKKTRIDLKMMKNADQNWVFLHPLPRSEIEVSDDLFYHENNISWDVSRNHLYIAMAIILTNLQEYCPKSEMPDF